MTVTPLIPPVLYRGDQYRLNFTSGLILAVLFDVPEGMKVDEIVGIVKRENSSSGIPGGSAGSQWTPPPLKAEKTFDPEAPRGKRRAKVDYVDEAVEREEGERERLPDTLKDTCTYFLFREDHVRALLALMDYVGLCKVSDDVVTLTDVGRGVYEMQGSLEDMEQDIASARGVLTGTQEYLAGHPDDTTGGDHLVPYRVVPFSITEAANVVFTYVRNAGSRADTTKIGAQMFASAATSGIQNPGVVRDVESGDLHLDSALPIRRNLQRRPSYRQFLWIVSNDPDTFVAAYATGNQEDPDGQDPDRVVETVLATPTVTTLANRGDRLSMRVREGMTITRATKGMAQTVLTGGPEGVWVGKPLQPRDVHADIVSFEAAGRAGMSQDTIGGSSILWEVYDRSTLTMHDYQLARERLTGVGDVGLYGATVSGESSAMPDLDEVIGSIQDEAEGVGTLSQAGRVVERTSDDLLTAVGINVISKRPTKSGVPVHETCTYVYKGNNVMAGGRNQRCRKPAIGGSGYCEIHGGTYLNPQETESLVRASQQKIFATSSKAVEVIADLMINSTNDAVRLRAAEQILNRSGLSEARDLNINVDIGDEKESPAQVVRNKLAALSRVDPKDQKEIERAQNRGDMSPYGEDERVVEAEIVEPN